MSAELELYGFDCPFVERTRLLLAFKDRPYQYTSLRDFNPTPQWFLDLNPLGKVPVLVHEGSAIYESSIINEYIEELFPCPPAFPQNLQHKAFSRILIDYCGQRFIAKLFALLMNRDGSRAEELMQQSLESWSWLNTLLMQINPEGDFAFGEAVDSIAGNDSSSRNQNFGMADLSYLPFFARYQVVSYYRHFELPDTEQFQRVRRWRDACLSHPLAEQIVMSEQNLIKMYYSHSQGWGAGRLPPKGEENSLDPSIPYSERPMPPRPDKDYWA